MQRDLTKGAFYYILQGILIHIPEWTGCEWSDVDVGWIVFFYAM